MQKYMLLFVCGCAVLLGGCFNLSPEHGRPPMPMALPTEYKEEKGWKTATPAEAPLHTAWWEMFQDATLNDLMQQTNRANQNIAVAAANLRQSRAQIGAARAAFLPGVSVPGSALRGKGSSGSITESYSVGLSAKWEISFWNAMPSYEAAKAQAEASAADYAAMRLSTQADLAQTYFQLRALDVQHELYESTIAAYAKAVQLTRSQYQGGVVTPADVAQAEAQLASAEAQLASIERQRAELEHGIAILVGQMPSSFALGRASLSATLPAVPSGMPSALLERRPDIASAERRVAVANQQIGIARAAWFPTFSLSADKLMQGAEWFKAPWYVWSIGPSAAVSLFEGGKRLADSDAAQAGYESTVASYRQTVLEAFRDVEDNLSALRLLEKEGAAQDRAVLASQAALRLSLSQYRGGMTTYLQVVNAQTSALTSERSAIQVQGQRLIAAVNLIKALGGGWHGRDLEALTYGKPPMEGTIVR